MKAILRQMCTIYEIRKIVYGWILNSTLFRSNNVEKLLSQSVDLDKPRTMKVLMDPRILIGFLVVFSGSEQTRAFSLFDKELDSVMRSSIGNTTKELSTVLRSPDLRKRSKRKSDDLLECYYVSTFNL